MIFEVPSIFLARQVFISLTRVFIDTKKTWVEMSRQVKKVVTNKFYLVNQKNMSL